MFLCLVHTFTLSLLLGNFIFGPENFLFVSGFGSASLVLLFESLNFVSVLNFGFTLGEVSSGAAELKKKIKSILQELGYCLVMRFF